MRRLSWLLPVAFFFLNPGLACGPAEPQYEYGADEMRAAVAGVWQFSIIPDGASAPVQVTVQIDQAATAPAPQARGTSLSFVRAAYACGSRTLVKSAAACLDSTTMPLDVKFLSGDASFASAAMSGTFLVYGLRLEIGNSLLSLKIGDYDIEAQLGPDRTLFGARIGPSGAPGSLAVVTND